MKQKICLSIEDEIIRRAKRRATEQGRSLRAVSVLLSGALVGEKQDWPGKLRLHELPWFCDNCRS